MKRILIIISILILIFTSASVCASEMDDAFMASENQGDEVVNLDDTSSVENVIGESAGADKENDMLKSTSKSFSDLNNDINSNSKSEINLTCDYIYNPDNDSDFKGGIAIKRDVTIDGNGFTIDANNTARIFRITSDYLFSTPNVTLKNIKFINANGSGNNGAAVNGRSTIINCTFINNTVTQPSSSSAASGGAVYAGTVFNSTFINNHADRSGGAIYAGTAENCIFINNSAGLNGGAIYMGSTRDCTFINNSAMYGGAVSGQDSHYSQNCTFINNSAKNDGGALIHVKVSKGIFEGNHADSTGGAVCDSIVLNSIFTNNSAGVYGGAIYESEVGDSLFEYNSAWIGGAISETKATNCTFNHNKADEYGGAAYTSEISTDCRLYNNTENDTYKCTYFVNEKSFRDLNDLIENGSNEIYLSDNYTFNLVYDMDFKEGIIINRPLTIYGNGFRLNGNDEARVFLANSSDVVFRNILFTNCRSGKGGAVSNGKVINCTFTNNYAGNGGAVYNCTSIDCTFTNNRGYYGGAASYGVSINCNFTGNTATCGGVLCNSTAVGCAFRDNYASSQGGVVYGRNSTCINSTFTNNKGYRGLVYGPSFNIINCSFINNSASNGGLITKGYLEDIYVIGSTNLIGINDKSTVLNCRFINNTAKEGGAVNGEGFVVRNCEFINNTAENGGAVYKASVVNSKFTNNTAQNGGAVYMSTVVNSLFEYNSAKNGGAIYEGLAYNCTFNFNHADVGGAAYMSRLSNSCSFTGNTINDTYKCDIIEIKDAKSFTELKNLIDGEETEIYLNDDYAYDLTVDPDFKEGIDISRPLTIYGNGHTLDGLSIIRIFNVKNTNVRFVNVTFINGKTSANGGAIVGSCSAINCTFINNYADANGGATCNVKVYGCQFIDNFGKNGGAVRGEAENCIFINNKAYSGGAIYGDATNCVFISNSATLSGGALYNGYALNCSFTNNHAQFTGGAMHGNFGTCLALNCNFTNNSAGENGGAISNGNANFCIFEQNHANRNGGAISNGNANCCNFTENYAGKRGGAIDGKNNDAFNCTFIGNTADSYGATYNVTLEECTLINNTDMKNPKLHVEDFISEYNSCEKLFVNITTFNGTQINGINVTIEIYNRVTLIDTVHCLSGDGWLVNLQIGEYRARLSVNDSQYDIDPIEVKMTINKMTPKVNVTIDDITYTQPIVFKITSNVGGRALVTLDVDPYNIYMMGVTENKTNQIEIKNIAAGTRTASVQFTPANDEYNTIKFNVNFTVHQKETNITLDAVDIPSTENLIVNVTATENGTVTVKVGNITKNITVNANETNAIDLGILPLGTYEITANFTANENYTSSSTAKTIKVFSKITPQIIIPPLDNITKGKSISIKLPNDAKGNVTLTINATDYIFEVENGSAEIVIPNLDDGTYPYTITYSGDKQYSAFESNGTLSIACTQPVATEIISYNINTVYNGGKNLIATLKDKNGTVLKDMALKVTINGKTLNRTTDANGQIKISSNGLAPKTYVVTISFEGNGNYTNATADAKITVKKATPKLTAKNKKFKKSKKTKKYTVTLKTNKNKALKNVKVTLKIKKKSFTAKTNAKGKATFKIKKLTKKGTYKSKVTFKGNKYYNKVSKKVKIKLK